MKSILTLTLLVLSIQLGYSQNTVLSFDGINDYVDLGPDVGDNIRTIECWFKLDEKISPQLADFSTLLAREISGTTGNTHEFSFSFQPSFVDNPGTLRFDVDGTFPYRSVYSDNNSWNIDQWYHAAAVIHPENGMSLFIDGIKQSSSHPRTGATSFSSEITTIGCWGKDFIRFFKGEIDDLRISAEALYDADFTPVCPDLTTQSSDVGVWNFNGSSGHQAIDSSGNLNHGFIVGALKLPADVCIDSTITNIVNSNLAVEVNVFPNPSSNHFQFNLQNLDSEELSLFVYNSIGEQVFVRKEGSNSFAINLSDYPTGVYFYLLKSGADFVDRGQLIKLNP